MLLLQCVQSQPALTLEAKLLLHDSLHFWPWKASAWNHQGCEPMHTIWLFLSLTHAHLLHSRLPNELKKQACVLADTYHTNSSGRDSPNRENYVRVERRQQHVTWDQKKPHNFSANEEAKFVHVNLSLSPGPVSFSYRLLWSTWYVHSRWETQSATAGFVRGLAWDDANRKMHNLLWSWAVQQRLAS